MAMNMNKLTEKAQEAIVAAQRLAIPELVGTRPNAVARAQPCRRRNPDR